MVERKEMKSVRPNSEIREALNIHGFIRLKNPKFTCCRADIALGNPRRSRRKRNARKRIAVREANRALRNFRASCYSVLSG